MKPKTTAAVLAAGFALALASPFIAPRHEAAFVSVEPIAAGAQAANGPWGFAVRVRNTHPKNLRVWLRAVDVSDSLAGGPAPGATHLPLAKVERFPVERELAPGDVAVLPLQLPARPAGHYEGTIDVVVDDGSSWVRAPVSVDLR